jgi:Flp pilus assembly protein TadG
MRYPAGLLTFARNEAGSVLVFWAVALGVILGIVAMSFDLGRASITRSELQSFADSVALAAAGELDGNNDALDRAAEAANLIFDSQSFGNTDRTLNGEVSFSLTYYASLPDLDSTALSDVTTDPAEAAFVQVQVTPTVVESTFGAAFAALTGQANRDYDLGASAVAGLSIFACDVTPMMFCLPTDREFRAEENIGTMIRLRAGGNGAAWGPGDFGFLDPRGLEIAENGPCARLNGAQLLACLIGAVDNITQCFDQRGVDMEPGQKVGLEDAIFNVRFDIYRSIMNGRRNDPNYAPAPNVIKGVVPNGGSACIGGNTGTADTSALPRDDCFPGCAPFGDGNWSTGRAAYVVENYGTGEDGTLTPHPDFTGTDMHSDADTRYEYYLSEIAAASAAGILENRLESGLPRCSNQPPAPPDRRVIIAAGINCEENGIRGAAEDVPVQEFFKIFLTEPVGFGQGPTSFEIYGEIIGSASEVGTGAGGAGGLVRDVVQLYR